MENQKIYKFTDKNGTFELTQSDMHVAYVFGGNFGIAPGGFTEAMIYAISKADYENFSKLSKEFPELCKSVKQWNQGNLYEQIQRAIQAKANNS